MGSYMRSIFVSRWSRRAFVCTLAGGMRASTVEQSRRIGRKKQLLMDRSLVQSSRDIGFNLNLPYLPDENLIRQDKPWETVRTGGYLAIAEHGGQYHAWYTAYPGG